MSKVSQYLLTLVATLSVGILGYYAYILNTTTLMFSTNGASSQYGSSLTVPLRSTWLSPSEPGSYIDTGALIQSLSKNQLAYNPTLSGEGYVDISRGGVRITPSSWSKGDIIKIDKSIYNTKTSKKWELPTDIILEYSDTPRGIEIKSIGLPRDLNYEVTTYGYRDMGPEDIRWYMRTLGRDRTCSLVGWDPTDWEEIGARELSSGVKGVKQIGTYHLDIDRYPSNTCVIAGLGGDSQSIIFAPIDPLTITGSVTDILSPEYDMLTRMEFSFTSDIFADSGTLYSEGYMTHRQQAKKELLSKISISGGVIIDEKNIELSPNKAVLYLNLREGEQYRVSLKDISDIYGRVSQSSLDIDVKSVPSLKLRMLGGKTIWKYGDPIQAKFYRTQGVKTSYPAKICEISLDAYARVERMNELKNKANITLLQNLLVSKDISACTSTPITVSSDSMMTPLDIETLRSKKLTPGLYIVSLVDTSDLSIGDRWIPPQVFAVVDTHITMKIDSSGKTNFLTTDIRTGEPRKNQDIILKKNISKLYAQNWNTSKNTYDIEYTPLSAQSWGTGILAGQTSQDGILTKEKIDFGDYDSLYGLTSEGWGDYEGRYSSFVAIAKGGEHFGYVVSTWNDGITGWNFGMKESDYGWENRSTYMSYLHTDRKLYLPGDRVYIKAIMRKNNASLTIPDGEVFDIVVTDPLEKISSTTRIKANSYGSLATSIVIPAGSALGSWSVNIVSLSEPNTWISGGYTNFQLEIFQNPTFTATVKLSSPEVVNNIVTNTKELAHTDINTYWYDKRYSSVFSLEGIVTAKYYNGTTMKNVPFSYRIYKSPHYDDSYWGYCFWGCYYEPTPEFYSEGTGSIDRDGYGMIRAGVDFSTFSDDYIYTTEVTIRDPLSGESVTTAGTLLVGIGQDMKIANTSTPLNATLEKRIIKPGEQVRANMAPKYGKWDSTLVGAYRYELVKKTYTSQNISTLRGESNPIVDTTESIIYSGKILLPSLTIDTTGLTAGEYFVRTIPDRADPTNISIGSISESILYITGDYASKESMLRVIPDKTVYQSTDRARILITTPYANGGHLYITREKGGVISSEYVSYSGSNYTLEYALDESFYPNVYIGVVAFPTGESTRGYTVGYGEIIMDLTDKKGGIIIKTDKETYKNREIVNIDLNLTDKYGKGESGEIEVMVVDESLIRLLGNIDLDIIPRFFQKYLFTMKTSLTAIGIERNKYLSRKGSNGGSGDKGGGGVEIASRILFQNTAYYNPSIITGQDGRARIKFELPDNVTDYRIIAIGQTKSSRFSVQEKTIAVRRDYTLETNSPSIVYPGDTTTIVASVFNTTPRIIQASIEIRIGSGGTLMRDTQSVIVNPGVGTSQNIRVNIGKDWSENIPYTIVLREQGKVLDSITKTLTVAKPPIISDIARTSGVLGGNGITRLSVPSLGSNTDPDSPVYISLSDTPLNNPERIIASLISYPYGCIEQTIASTLPNALALQFSKDLDISIDTTVAKKNLQEGVDKILRMQDERGGWKYWENDTTINDHITPYVIRSLYEFRKLGIAIPDSVISRGLDYIANIASDDGGTRAEIFATLAQGKHPRATEIQSSIDTSRLSRHGYLIYHMGLVSLGQYDSIAAKNLTTRMNTRQSESYWYWDNIADEAIYTRLLLQIGDRDEAAKRIVNLVSTTNLESYYVSTQAKIQLFLALTSLSNKTPLSSPIEIRSGRLKIDIDPSPTKHRYAYETRRSLIGSGITISTLSGTRLYYDVRIEDVPIDREKVKPISHPQLRVDRVFEEIDESIGLDSNGEFKSAKIINNGQFKIGQLYRVRLSATTSGVSTPQYYLTLEDYIPGGWRPIQGVLNTESSSTTDNQGRYGSYNRWTHTEATLDRILATQDYVGPSDQPYIYTYYIRPEHSGTYLLPPVTAYYMYHPEIHATSSYSRITVR